MRRLSRLLLVLLAIALVPVAAVAVVRLRAGSPSDARTWAEDHAIAPRVEFTGDSARIYGFRRFRHDSAGRATPMWDTVAVDLSKLERVWFVLVPFGREWMGMAHPYVTFGFADSQFVAISVEARRERGEQFGIWPGLTRRLELLYVIGDENDLVRQRVVRGYESFVYPIRTTRARELFESMLRRGDALRTRPEFYDVMTSNCTSNLVDHVNALVPGRVPKGFATLFPNYADRVAAEIGLIAAEGDRDALRARFRANDIVHRLPDDARFSVALHEALGDTVGRTR